MNNEMIWRNGPHYVMKTSYPDLEDPKLMKILLNEEWNKKRFATQLGEAMIANGCVMVRKDYHMDELRSYLYFMARPWKQERKLP